LLVLEEQGGDVFFGEPALNIHDLLRRSGDGRGMVNILSANKLIGAPQIYSTFLLWLLAELFEQLPEVGDPDRPNLVFFFDEAHLLFKDTPKALQDKIEQVVRLIRSKGVGVYFVTQTPLDIPDSVLGQLGNRIQHALRAFTPRDQKVVRAAAETFRGDGRIDVASVITELGVGEALVSCLDEKGSPQVVQRALICPPQSRIGPLSDAERETQIRNDPLYARYKLAIDRESAYELLKQKAAASGSPKSEAPVEPEVRGAGRPRQGLIEAMAKSAVRTIGSQVGREIVRGIMGALLGGRRR
jgi:DNA helicase HerA-like ATPase